MVIAVTGAAGRVGEFVVTDLVSHGHEVVAVDIKDPGSAEATYRPANVEDTAGLVAAFSGCDAVIHLAAIPEVGIAPADVTFRVNA